MHPTSFLIRCALAAATPLKRMTARSTWIEERLELPLGEADHARIAKALELDKVSLGHYYHWYLEKKLIARELRRATPERVLAFAAAADQTDYTSLDRVFDAPEGLVLAIPHYGNYIQAIVRLFARYGTGRDIGVFYASPESNKGNAVFDFIYDVCFKNDPKSRTRVLHANRAGLADALKLLKSGGVLLMLPDVCLNPDDAYLVPFLGRTFEAMLGSASFARRTDARLVPCMAVQTGNLAFQIRSADPIHGHRALRQAPTRHAELVADYAATARLFATYEAWMQGRTYMWQPIREYFGRIAAFTSLDPQGLEKVWSTFLADPRVQLPSQAEVFDIDAQERGDIQANASSLALA